MNFIKKFFTISMTLVICLNVFTIGTSAHDYVALEKVVSSNDEIIYLNSENKNGTASSRTIVDSLDSRCTVISSIIAYPAESKVVANGTIKNNTSTTCLCSIGNKIYNGSNVPTNDYSFEKTQNVVSNGLLKAEPKYKAFYGSGIFSSRANGSITYNGLIYSAEAIDKVTYK